MVDRLITLFSETDTEFNTNGIGPLPDAIKCIVTEERNGSFELEMEYPVDGKLYNEIAFRKILLVKPNPYTNRQPFRIYSISKPLSGRVTINAAHISYDLSNYTVSPFEADSLSSAFTAIKDGIDLQNECKFNFIIPPDKNNVEATMRINVPMNARSILGGIEGSVLDTYRGEYEWDCYNVILHNNRGADRGVSIRYGKNLTDLKQDENCSDVYTAVRPYWYKESNPNAEEDDGGLVEIESLPSSNLMDGSIAYGPDEDQFDTDISESGVITSGSTNFKMNYAKVEKGIEYVIITDEDPIVCGFFTSMPDVGSVTYNGSRVVFGAGVKTFTAPIDGYIAYRSTINSEGTIIDRLPYNITFVDAYSEYTRVLPLDLTQEFDHKPTELELIAATIAYINDHDIGVPKVSLEVSFINLSDSSEYKDIAMLEKVVLCDTVDIVFPKLGVNASAKVTKTIYDALAGRYESIELGEPKSSISDTVSIAKKDIEEKVTTTELEQSLKDTANLITGNRGGYVVLYPAEQPQEILILDANSGGVISQATNIWRWNSSGLAFSSNGYNPDKFDVAINMNGEIDANFIKTGFMSANQIFGGTLVLGSNMGETGDLKLYDADNRLIATLDLNGLTLYGQDGFYLRANATDGFSGRRMAPGMSTPASTDEKIFWITEDVFHMKRADVENDINFCGKMRFVPITIYDQQGNITNNGIALVASS